MPTRIGGSGGPPSTTAGQVGAPAGPLLREGSRGPEVKALQESLTRAGFPLENDGIFGPKTKAAVTAFQQARGLTVDGLAGPQTQGALASGQPQGQGWTPGTQQRRPGPTGPSDVGGPTSRPVDEAQLRRALAVQLVKPGGSATREDVAAVIDQVQQMPLGQLQQLQRQGTSVVACRGSVTDHMAELRGVQPRGWPPGATWDQVPGLFSPQRNEVVVATTAGNDGARVVPATGQGHGSANLVMHEAAHALDYRGGNQSRNDPEFLRAYEADKANLAPYLQQPGDAGREEAFAESLAMFLTGQGQSAPNLMRYWAEHNPYPARS